MSRYSLSHLSDGVLERRVEKIHVHACRFTAWELAHIAEYDARRLFVPKGYPSMYEYCVRHLGMSDDCALKRIRAARAARLHPPILEAIAAGRLHLSGLAVLARHVTAENGAELLAAAVGRTRVEIILLVAERFPQPDVPTRVEALPGASCRQMQVAPGPVDASTIDGAMTGTEVAPGPPEGPRPKVKPLSAGRYLFQATIGQSAHDKLRYLQALLGHTVPSGDPAAVFELAMDALIEKQEKQKFAATTRPGRERSSVNPRHIPAHVKRTVWLRDGAQCTFVGDAGNRCPARAGLEYDHVDPVARGGVATVDGIRLRCRAHNQYEAECVFGAGFMQAKREAAKLAAEEARARAAIARAEAQEKRAAAAEQARTERAAAKEARAAEAEREKAGRAAAMEARAAEAVREKAERAAAKEARAAEVERDKAERAAAREEKANQEAAERDPDRSVVPWLRQLGFTIEEARRAAVFCENMPDVALEKRIREAIRYLSPQHRPVAPFASPAA